MAKINIKAPSWAAKMSDDDWKKMFCNLK